MLHYGTGIPRMSAAAAAIPGISIQTAPTSAPTLIGRDTSAQISVRFLLFHTNVLLKREAVSANSRIS